MGDIKLENIYLRYDETLVFDHLNETIPDGMTYVIIGKSGCGKSSLLKIMSGLFPFASGKVIIEGKDIFSLTKYEMLDFHAQSGFVFEGAGLINNLSIYENLSLYYHYHYPDKPEEEISARIMEYLELIGLIDDVNNRPNALSTGEQVMVSIVRAIIHEPKYIFWDEPVSNLDILTTDKVVDIINAQKHKQVTQVIVTHSIEFAERIGDRIAILHEGKIVDSGTSDELQRSEVPITRELFNLDPHPV